MQHPDQQQLLVVGEFDGLFDEKVESSPLTDKRRRILPNDYSDNKINMMNDDDLLSCLRSPFYEEGDDDYDDNNNSNNNNNEDDDDNHIFDTSLPISSVGTIPHPPLDLTESLIAKRMSQLSMKDREAAYYDIHGVTDTVNEEEDGFLESKILDFEMALQKVTGKDREAYELARSTDSSYVDNHDFQLRFLRADRFNAKLAAARYVKFFTMKLDLFGAEKIARDIVQDDLGEEAVDALYSGIAQLLPRRDNAGRLVFFLLMNQQLHSIQAVVGLY